jgi:hypothetical protein
VSAKSARELETHSAQFEGGVRQVDPSVTVHTCVEITDAAVGSVDGHYGGVGQADPSGAVRTCVEINPRAHADTIEGRALPYEQAKSEILYRSKFKA